MTEKEQATNWYVCYVLAGLFMLANIDRFVINLMVEPIKRDFGVSDTEISLLIGFTFSLFYVLAGVPIARLADRSNRRNILTAGVTTWSLMTALAGVAQNYLHLFIVRIGIGVGEATITPCAHSIMSDTLPPDKLGRGFSIYTIGGVLGGALAFIFGGALIGWAEATYPNGLSILIFGHIYSWQLVFILLGLPGLLVAALFFLTVREPARSLSTGASDRIPLKEVFAFLRRNRSTAIGIYGGLAVMHVGAGALAAWLPALLERKFDINPSQSAPFLVSAIIIPGAFSAITAGWLADRLLKRKQYEAHLRISMIGAFIGFLPAGLSPLAPSAVSTAILTGVGYYFVFMAGIVCPAALQIIGPNRMRSTLASFAMVAITLIGFGTGPTFVALITDFVFRDESMLPYSLAIVCTLTFGGAGLFFAYGQRQFARMMRLAQKQSSQDNQFTADYDDKLQHGAT